MGREWFHDRDEEGGRSKERWLITYADLITLLLVFFIVMYALSARINMTSFEEVSHSLAAALKRPSPKPGDKFAYSQDDSKQTRRFKADADAVVKALIKTDPKSKVKIDIDQRGLIVSLIDTSFFDPGSATLKPTAYTLLERMASNFRTLPNEIRVEGHTDSIPIHTARFPSNWDLSAARAVSVVRFLTAHCGIPAGRLYAVGYGANMPVATNATAQGRERNRRVDIIVERAHDENPALHGIAGNGVAATPAPHPAATPAPANPFANGFNNPFAGK